MSTAAAVDDVPFGQHLVFSPARGPCEAAVVWLHGFGDTPEGWASELRSARASHPQWKWVHLRGRELPQKCYGGQRVPGWGDYHDEGCTRVGSPDYDNQDIVLETSLAEVRRVINELETKDGVPPERVVLGGFSMGATAAAEAAVRHPQRLAGLVMLNGWLLPGARSTLRGGPPTVQGLPVLVSHGSSDEQVGFDCGREAAETLTSAGARVRFEVQEGLAHVISGFGPGKNLAVKFLVEVLGTSEGTGTDAGCSAA